MKLTKIIFSLLILPAFAVAQGLVIETSMSGGPMGDDAQTSSSMAVPKKFKTGLRKNEYVLVRLDKEMMYRVNTEKKTYMELTFTQLEEKRKNMMAQMGPQMEQMKAQMKNMPEEQRKMMEKMMANMGGASSDAKVEVKATGEKLKIAGFDAAKYTFSQDGKEVASVWVSKDTPEYANLKKDYAEFRGKMGALNPGMSKSLNEAMQSVEGFPLQTIMANGMKIVVTKIEKKAIADSEFELPTGYTKTEERSGGRPQ